MESSKKTEPTAYTHPMNPNIPTLPDFCANRVVFAVVTIAQILATVLALAKAGVSADFWSQLAINTLFIQWVALTISATLCPMRSWFSRHSTIMELTLVFLVALGLTFALTLAALQLARLLDFLPDGAGMWFVVWRNLALSAIVTLAALRYFYVQQQWKQKIEAETQSRLQALQARIRPHFLFNSLNTIANLATEDPEQAEEAVLDLADMFRAALKDKPTISLTEELDIARKYLRVEERRLGEKLTIVWEVDDELPGDVQVPALLLQPLLENAVYHGIQQLPGDGTIDFKASLSKNGALFRIVNPVADSKIHEFKGNGIGLENSRQRIALSYGDSCSFRAEEQDGDFVISFTLPINQ